jgi:AcrR family transcriptional regulator
LNRPDGATVAVKKKKPAREAVLDAAVALVEESGAGALTLDAVAARAGVSKGGLLHHFKSKEALLLGMIARVEATFEKELSDAAAAMTETAGQDSFNGQRRLVEAYLERSFSGMGARDKTAMTLFAVAAHQPALMEPIRDYFRRRATSICRQFPEPTLALALMALADGLWIFDALGIPPFEGKLREQVRDEVLRWANAALDAAADADVAKRTVPTKPPRRRASKASRRSD